VVKAIAMMMVAVNTRDIRQGVGVSQDESVQLHQGL